MIQIASVSPLRVPRNMQVY